ncbi:hypothetical protein DLC02_07110 [Salmonella enterica subsp. enterica serovar Chittagong]|nr:hypothetical protein [Salmonella enterica subsp. enterica serovar Chittagong]
MWKIAFLIITLVLDGSIMKPLHELLILNHFYYCFFLESIIGGVGKNSVKAEFFMTIRVVPDLDILPDSHAA